MGFILEIFKGGASEDTKEWKHVLVVDSKYSSFVTNFNSGFIKSHMRGLSKELNSVILDSKLLNDETNPDKMRLMSFYQKLKEITDLYSSIYLFKLKNSFKQFYKKQNLIIQGFELDRPMNWSRKQRFEFNTLEALRASIVNNFLSKNPEPILITYYPESQKVIDLFKVRRRVVMDRGSALFSEYALFSIAGGVHLALIAGVELDSKNNLTSLIIKNSWGTDYGDDGYKLLPTYFLNRVNFLDTLSKYSLRPLGTIDYKFYYRN
ncbi:MAG: hypothetical protein ABL927_07570 [Bdellovibrionales bacterium]